MSKNYNEKNSFPEKDYNNQDLSLDKHIAQKNQNVQIYDNDDAYMLNLENNMNKENDSRENISDLDNYDKLKEREKENVDKNNNICDEIDDEIDIRKGFNSLNNNSKNNNEKNNKISNINSNNRKKGNRLND